MACTAQNNLFASLNLQCSFSLPQAIRRPKHYLRHKLHAVAEPETRGRFFHGSANLIQIQF